MSLLDSLSARFRNRSGTRAASSSQPAEDAADPPKPQFSLSPELRKLLDESAELRAQGEREQQAAEAERLRQEKTKEEAEAARRHVQELRREWDREMARREAELPPKEPGYEPPADW